MASYTDATAIAAYLGVTLTSPQQTQATAMAAAATAHVERYTGRTWQAGAISDEIHTAYRGMIRLGRAVASVASVKYRTLTPDETPTTLETASWELFDATAGVILVSLADDTVALVSYTPVSTVPADVAHATTMIAAAWMSQTLQPGTQGISQVSVGQNDLSVRYAEGRGDVPAEATTILKGYRKVVLA